jgi:2-oxoisovalerate dehydrogenase E1 component
MNMSIDKNTLKQAFKNVATAKTMTELYEENFKVVSKYVQATTRGHEVNQNALGLRVPVLSR